MKKSTLDAAPINVRYVRLGCVFYNSSQLFKCFVW